jgi:hypothetical protein
VEEKDGGRSQAPVLVSKEERPYKEIMGDSQEDAKGREGNRKKESTGQEDRAENHGGVRRGGGEENSALGVRDRQRNIRQGDGGKESMVIKTDNTVGEGETDQGDISREG